MRSRPRIIVAGYFVRFPVGGYVWQTLHHLIGFARLGCDVFFYEDTAYYSLAFDPRSAQVSTEYEYGVERLGRTLERFGLRDGWAFWNAKTNEYHGQDQANVDRRFADADLFVNLGGINRLGDRPRPKACFYVDIDPAFTQIRLEQDAARRGDLVAAHDVFFTYGENVGTPRSPLPTAGIEWRATRPPVVGDFWQTTTLAEGAPFTTVGRWHETSRDVEFRGERYHWQKSLEWKKFLDLPCRTGERFELAMDVERIPEDHRALIESGWAVRSPAEISADPDAYRRYIQESKGEFTAAKDMNVRLRSGWFSDRTVCYLAAGRPAVLQDTGFGDVMPTGQGLFAVRTLEDAIDAFQRIRADYPAHCAAARAIAADGFEATRVLRPMLEAAGF